MELYNFIRIGGRVVKIARFSTRQAEQHEDDLHRAFSFVQFDQTKQRRFFKGLLQCLYLYLVYYGATSYNLTPEQLQTAYIGSVAAFFCLFHAEIKIEISRDSGTRLGQVNNNLSSGYTEWFAVPWFLVPFIPLVIWHKVNPVTAIFFTAIFFAGFFLGWKYLML